MKTVFLMAILFVLPAHSTTLSCNWINNDTYEKGFFKPAAFSITINESEAIIFDDSYFSRRYEPCWVGNFSSCYFSFGMEKNKAWNIVTKNNSTIELEQTWYFTSNLTISFSQNLEQSPQGQTIDLLLNGYDGDGVSINNNQFTCTVK